MTQSAIAQLSSFKRWDPAGVIDSAKLIIVAEQTDYVHSKPVARGTQILGTVHQVHILKVLDGPDIANTDILIFQPSAGGDMGPIALDPESVLFLKPLDGTQRDRLQDIPAEGTSELLKRLASLPKTESLWTFASHPDQWMSYYPLKRNPKYRFLSPLDIQLKKVGVDNDKALGYLQELITLRRKLRSQRGSTEAIQDVFKRSVIAN